jgi:hypothetical protein
MIASAKRVEVVHWSAWFVARLSALLSQAGYAVAPFESVTALRRAVDRPPPVAIVLHLTPTSEARAENIVATLRTERGFAGPMVVLDRVQKAEGVTQYLPRDASPARAAAAVRGLVEAAPCGWGRSPSSPPSPPGSSPGAT